MRYLLVLALFALTACEVTTSPGGDAARQPASSPPSGFRQTKSAQQGIRDYERVARRIEPVAERVCRETNPNAPRTFCDFRITVDRRDKQGPNASQSIGRDGRPVIAFNMAMLVTVENDDELAFILGHEAGHQVARHLVKANAAGNLGAAILGSIFSASGASQQQVKDAAGLGGFLGARAYSKEHELEADVIGTYIAHFSGYDPLRGAQSFRRFTGGGGFLSTHPPSPQRFSTVERTVARIRAGQPMTLR